MDLHNLEEYISLVVDATVRTGVTRQMEAFRAGFNQVNDFLYYLNSTVTLIFILRVFFDI